jgi:glycosyltransferase involved in cell wall biosynthesis
MKVALLIDSLTSGGAQRQMVLLANGLSDIGYDVCLFVYHDIMQLRQELNVSDTQLVKVIKHHKYEVRFIFRLISAFNKFQPDVIVSFLNSPNILARLCGPHTSAKAIITSERNTDLVKSKPKVIIERLLGSYSTKVVVNTFMARNQLIEVTNIPPSKIEVICNGVDTEQFCRDAELDLTDVRTLYNLKESDFVIVLPARIERQKNHLCLVEAIAKLECDRSRIKVRLFGNENDLGIKTAIVERIEALGLQSCIQFSGTSNAMPLIYNLADLVILPSDWEGLPNVVLEAMACETPVIISDVSDNHRLVEHGVSGFLFARNDSDQLSAQIATLLESTDDYRRQIGIAARARIEKYFSTGVYVKQFSSLIQTAVKIKAV